MNKHDKLAGLLGILPAPLLLLLKELHPDRKVLHQVTTDLKLNTFFGAYSIWKRRQTLQKIHFKNKIPEIRKKKKRAANGPPKKRRKPTKAEQFDRCVNPFHYLELSHPNQSPKLTCPCNYQMPHTRDQPLDLSHFLDLKPSSCAIEPETNIDIKRKRKFPDSYKTVPIDLDLSGIDRKYPLPLPTINFDLTQTSGQISAEHQDRRKRFKQKTLDNFFLK